MWFLERCLVAKKWEVGKLESWKVGKLVSWNCLKLDGGIGNRRGPCASCQSSDFARAYFVWRDSEVVSHG